MPHTKDMYVVSLTHGLLWDHTFGNTLALSSKVLVKCQKKTLNLMTSQIQREQNSTTKKPAESNSRNKLFLYDIGKSNILHLHSF